jgi:hypothetical protein
LIDLLVIRICLFFTKTGGTIALECRKESQSKWKARLDFRSRHFESRIPQSFSFLQFQKQFLAESSLVDAVSLATIQTGQVEERQYSQS